MKKLLLIGVIAVTGVVTSHAGQPKKDIPITNGQQEKNIPITNRAEHPNIPITNGNGIAHPNIPITNKSSYPQHPGWWYWFRAIK